MKSFIFPEVTEVHYYGQGGVGYARYPMYISTAKQLTRERYQELLGLVIRYWGESYVLVGYQRTETNLWQYQFERVGVPAVSLLKVKYAKNL
jgi:hypothetical protein